MNGRKKMKTALTGRCEMSEMMWVASDRSLSKLVGGSIVSGSRFGEVKLEPTILDRTRQAVSALREWSSNARLPRKA